MNASQIPPYPIGRNLLEGKTVLVTASAGTGIGFATARRCAEEGATVMLSDMHAKRLAKYREELEKLTGSAVYSAVCNVTDEAQVQTMFEHAISEMGHIDVLVNNAGLGGTQSIVDMTDEQWNAVIDVTLGGTFRCVRAALRHMIPRGTGSIVNLGSVVSWRAQAEQAHYGAAKAGVLALTRAAAAESARAGVRVNAVVPSLAMHPNLAKVSSDEFLAELVDKETFGRGAEPWEISNIIVFLASDLSSFMTGEAISASNQHP